MTARTLFVTGTDTGVGKTLVACALLRGLRAAGWRAVGYKPVASGCEDEGCGLRNADALALQAAGTPGWAYADINPYAFEPAIAPHIAAGEAGVTVDIAALDAGHERLAAASDWVIVEGAGGWRVPLSDSRDYAAWVAGHAWPVLLVVGMRLGCINHALLSAEAIAARTSLMGWIANTLPEVQPRLEQNRRYLEAHIAAPQRARIGLDPAPDLCLNPSRWLTPSPGAGEGKK